MAGSSSSRNRITRSWRPTSSARGAPTGSTSTRVATAFSAPCDGWLEDATLHVSSDPFGGARVPLRILARKLPVRTYGSAGALRAALDAAPVEIVEGRVVGAAEQR